MILDTHINGRIPAEMFKEIKHVSHAEKMTVSETLRMLLAIGLNKKACERFPKSGSKKRNTNQN